MLEADGRFAVAGARATAARRSSSPGGSSVDAVVMDIEMPEVDGVEATRAPPGAEPELPVLAISGHEYEERVLEIRAAGAGDYVRKSRVDEDLVDALVALLGARYCPGVEIVELSADEVRAAAGELAQLLLDAHASNMALGLAAPLTPEHAGRSGSRRPARLDPERGCSSRRATTASSSAPCRSCARRPRTGPSRRRSCASRCGATAAARGIGRGLLEAAVERARALGLRLSG